MEKIDKAIEILQAFKEGKIIEWYDSFSQKWLEVKNITKISLFENIRVKPQPTYRPYANAEEFLEASKKHGPYIWFSNLEGIYAMPTIIAYKGITLTKNDESYNEILNYCKWQDGTPCGILEQ